MTQAKLKIKKGDQVLVITGKDKGKKGDVLKVLPEERRVIVSGINVLTHYNKPSRTSPQGGIEKKEASIHISNVSLVDAKSGKPTRVGYKIEKDGSKVRIARSTGEKI